MYQYIKRNAKEFHLVNHPVVFTPGGERFNFIGRLFIDHFQMCINIDELQLPLYLSLKYLNTHQGIYILKLS